MNDARPVWRSPVTWGGALASAAVLVFLLTVAVEDAGQTHVVLWLLTVGIGAALAWTVVRSRQERRRFERELASWAADRARRDERLHLAAELHDVVSHGLGLITVRAAAAQAGTAADWRQGLEDIEQTSRAATVELRRMLGLLREPTPAPLAPSWGLDDLPQLMADVQRQGLEVEVSVQVENEPSPGLQLVAHAVVREGLRNALRHAGPTRAVVEVSSEADGVRVEVRDEGPVPGWEPHPGAGHGLLGLSQRVEAVGGSLTARRRDAGFELSALLPERGSA